MIRQAMMMVVMLWMSSCLAVKAGPPLGVAPAALSSAESLQAVIDRGGPLVYVPKGQYTLAAPLALRSDLTLVWEPGTVVEAAQGAFQGVYDSLVQLVGVRNVTWIAEGCTFRMRKSDYRDPAKYAKSEFRHVLDVRGTVNVTITGGTYAESGGDGIYIGPLVTDAAGFPNGKKRAPNERLIVRRVHCDGNLRQGVSVVACHPDCVIEDSLLTRTSGSSPQAGIDIEPEPYDPIDVTVRRCRSEGNRGPAYMWSLQHTLPTLAPVRIVIEASTYQDVPADQPTLRMTGIFNGAGVSPTGYLCDNLPKGSHLQWGDLVWRK